MVSFLLPQHRYMWSHKLWVGPHTFHHMYVYSISQNLTTLLLIKLSTYNTLIHCIFWSWSPLSLAVRLAKSYPNLMLSFSQKRYEKWCHYPPLLSIHTHTHNLMTFAFMLIYISWGLLSSFVKIAKALMIYLKGLWNRDLCGIWFT